MIRRDKHPSPYLSAPVVKQNEKLDIEDVCEKSEYPLGYKCDHLASRKIHVYIEDRNEADDESVTHTSLA